MNIIVSEFSSGFADSTYPLCNHLARENPENRLTYLSDTNNGYFEKTDPRVQCIPLFQAFPSGEGYRKGSLRWLANRIMLSIRNARERNRFVKREKPDITLVMATLSTIDQFYLGRMKSHTAVLMTVHDVIVPQKSFSWGKRSLKRTYDIADGLVVHSETNKKQLMELFGVPEEKIEVIHHGLETDYEKRSREECRKQLGLDGKQPVLLFYGGIRRSKGLDVLLEALAGVPCKLVIAGSMPYQESFDGYDKQIEKNGIDCLKYITFTDDAFRDVLFQAADFIVFPYKEFYSQSGVFLQAIHYRKPVIATDVSSFRDFIERYRMGYCCKPNDVKSLHDTVIKALEELRKGCWEDTSRLDEAAKENSWEKSAEKYLRYFEKKVKK